jgi:hypothetical protein
MTRLSALARNPRRTLGALAVVLAAVGVTVGSGANFQANSANAGNAFTTGKLLIANSNTGAVLSTGKLVPGQSELGSVDIENTGDVDGMFSLKTSNPVDSNPSLLGQLNLQIQDCGTNFAADGTPPSCNGVPPIYTGKVNGITSLDLNRWAPNEKHHFEFTVSLPDTTPDTYQGLNAKIDFNWSAASTPN